MVMLFLISINYSLDTIMLKNLSIAYSVGIYSVGVSLSNIFLIVSDAFKDVLFGESSRKDFNLKSVYEVLKVAIGISFIGFIGWLLMGKILIELLYGDAYLESFDVTSIMFIGCFFLIIFKILQPVFISYGKQKLACLYLMASAITNIIANYILIPSYTYIGAAVASVISYAVCGILFFYKFYVFSIESEQDV